MVYLDRGTCHPNLGFNLLPEAKLDEAIMFRVQRDAATSGAFGWHRICPKERVGSSVRACLASTASVSAGQVGEDVGAGEPAQLTGALAAAQAAKQPGIAHRCVEPLRQRQASSPHPRRSEVGSGPAGRSTSRVRSPPCPCKIRQTASSTHTQLGSREASIGIGCRPTPPSRASTTAHKLVVVTGSLRMKGATIWAITRKLHSDCRP